MIESKKTTNTMMKKRFRVSEFLAEKLITGTAFISFAFIVLIFIFVFRETLPIFSPPEEVMTTEELG